MAEKRKEILKWALGGFFALMLLFTILSRLVDSYETAKVRLAYVSRGSVTKTVEGNGSVEPGKEQAVWVEKGLRVGEIAASVGAEVKTGDLLFRYTEESIERRLEEVERSIREQELLMEQERERGKSFSGVTEEELADQAVALAQREQERQSRKFLMAQEEYRQQTERLRDYYEKRLELSEEELIRSSQRDYDASRSDYKSTKLERDSGLRALKQEISTAEKQLEKANRKLEALEEGTDAEKAGEKDQGQAAGEKNREEREALEEEISELSDKISYLEEELEASEESWDLKVDEAREEMKAKADIYDRAGEESDSARLALKEAYENGLRQEEAALEAARDAMDQAALALSEAILAQENARKNEQAKRLSQEQERRLSQLQQELLGLELTSLEEEREDLKELSQRGGAVTAPFSGCVSLCELEVERELAGSERFLLSVGGSFFKGTFDREESVSLKAGETMDLYLEGEPIPIQTVISQVDLITEEEKGTVTAALEGGTASLGQRGSFEVKQGSEIYSSIIPSGALRRDTKGWYCLVARTQKTILGEEYKAARVDLQLLMAGDTMAAVEGALSEEEPVIAESDRVVTEGDRVRPMTDLIP